jgi:mannose/fructose/N-acetylgalactosamine-specific phosphotransferase system component IID
MLMSFVERDSMKIEKKKLVDSLLLSFYRFMQKDYNKHSRDYSQGYRAGMLDVIEKVYKYEEDKNE